MIINQVNGDDRKTIDTETGIYMTGEHDHPLYPSMTFQFHIGERIITFGVVYEEDESTRKPVIRRYTAVDSAGFFSDLEEAEYYLQILPAYLNVFNYSYGDGDGTVKYIAKYMRPKQVLIAGKGFVNV
jgi:hypothetical protein